MDSTDIPADMASDSSHCKKKIHNRPDHQVNTELRDMVEHFNNIKVRGEGEVLAKPGEVPCDVCREPKLKAQKMCLECLTSYCQPHLELHQTVTTHKKHQLTDPLPDLEDRVCKKHDKMFELFCQVDETCVCFMCLKDDHATHKAVPLEHAFREKKALMVDGTPFMKMRENAISENITKIKSLTEQSKNESEKEIADVAEVFSAQLVSLVLRYQAELIELIKEKQKAAEKQAEDHVATLEQQRAQLRRMISTIEQLLQSDDRIRVLQDCTPLHIPASLCPLRNTQDLSVIRRQSYMGWVNEAVTQMEKTLSNQMEMLIHKVSLSDGCDAAEKLMTDEFIKEVWNPPQDKLMMLQQYHAVDVTLDAYTANSKLVVSEDGKQLRAGDGRRFFPALFRRAFEHEPYVLGTDGFSSGSFYYEVRVSESKCFVLGVVKESIDREMFGAIIPERGGWTMFKFTNQFEEEYYGHFRAPALNLTQSPQTIGVFVDYERGEVSFYDVDTRTLVHSYTGYTFNETTPTLKAFLYSMAGTTSSSRPKLYPVFGLYNCDSNDVLTITPVANTT